ncbi:MAG: T9SS type A sorting domain-containing protein [Bacteroidetes bacterium]|nr:T9SS type A sorting domain-containing protein [Bacteroidota bacterium]
MNLQIKAIAVMLKGIGIKTYIFLLLSASISFADSPTWSVKTADYEMSASMTAQLYLDKTIVTGAGNMVGVFSGDSCRGVATPIYTLGKWYYFITIYSNEVNEKLKLKAYLAAEDTVLDIKETLVFQPNAIFGRFEAPYELNTFLNYDFTPALSAIPDQTIEVGESFKAIPLADYLSQNDSDPVIFNYSGNNSLTVIINLNNVATITPPSSSWTGTEKIIFTAVEQTANGLSAADTAMFTILPQDHQPILSAIPGQTIGYFGNFTPINLNYYLSEQDGDLVKWDYLFTSKIGTNAKPSWAVDAFKYQSSMTITAKVQSKGKFAQSGDLLLGAFAVDHETTPSSWECRGVASPVSFADSWEYYLTIYSNTPGEEIVLRYFDDNIKSILPVKEKLIFATNAVYGSPLNPLNLNAGNIIINIAPGDIAILEIIDSSWVGSETVKFIAADYGTRNAYNDTASATFKIIPDHHPIVGAIKNQTIESGRAFTSFDLDNYLTEIDGEPVIWSKQGNANLLVSIDNNNMVTVSPVSVNWIGSELITFIAKDNTANGLSGSTSARFTILPADLPPVVAGIPSQTTGLGSNFAKINLDDYLTRNDNDSISWSYSFSKPTETDTIPQWNVNAGDFENTMTITALVNSRGKTMTDGNFLLAAFAEDTEKPEALWECRGVAAPVKSMNSWMYFLIIYANKDGEKIRFKFYDNKAQKVYPIKQRLNFLSNVTIGNPAQPSNLDAGFLLISIDKNTNANVEIVDSKWTDSESVWFIATDVGSIHNYSDSAKVNFTVAPDHAPSVSGIPDQHVESGNLFTVFDLDDYLYELDGEAVIWSASGFTNLQVVINNQNQVTVTSVILGWTGSESVIFKVTDNKTNGFFSSDTARFTISALDHAPEILEIPEQFINPSRKFPALNLNNYLSEIDGDSVEWSYMFPVNANPIDKPDWNVNSNNYEQTMTVTSTVVSRGKTVQNSDNLLAAFSGSECRGAASPQSVGSNWVYFLTVYSNTSAENINFKFYDANNKIILPVKETLPFSANEIHGDPLQPVNLNAGVIIANINGANVASISILDTSWVGIEEVQFIAKDFGTLHEYEDSQIVKFNSIEVKSNNRPTIKRKITDKTIYEDSGKNLIEKDLNDVFVDVDNDKLSFSATLTGNSINATISNDSLFLTTKTNANGINFIVVTASDGDLDVSDTLNVIILPVNDLPFFVNLPDSISFLNDTNYTISLFEHIVDVETEVSLLIFDFTVSNDSLSINYDEQFGMLKLSAHPNFSGDTELYISVTDSDSAIVRDTIDVKVDFPTGLDHYFETIPQEYVLFQNYPNPFNPSTKIKFGIPRESNVRLEILNILGQNVATLVDRKLAPGYYEFEFNALSLSSGIYLYRFQSVDFTSAKKMLILK